MSFVSVLPFADTFAYWWRELDGDPRRIRFMTVKTLEVSAFLGNRMRGHSKAPETAQPLLGHASQRPPNTVPIDPVVVVVVPVYCRSDRDARSVEALLGGLGLQSSRCHVLLVDDGSPRWRAPAVEVIRLDRNLGPAAARNRGVERALEFGADVVAFIDSDCIPAPDWVANIIPAFHTERRAHAISGATWSLDRTALGRYQERNGTLNGRRLRGEDRLLYGPTCNLALCGELARCLRFDESFKIAAAEDIDYCFRANQQGWSIYHAESVVVQHDYGYDELAPVGRVRRLWSQFRRYAEGERLLLRKHPDYHQAFAGSTEISLPSRTDV
ncbi:MAG: glycosyltransferase [Deltaproteobacteria bacterium]|nr:glycosyltransferase [Deltaproteobacteria bacterium]